jgi:hypothetical protein
MHLVEMDLSFGLGQIEKMAANIRELNGLMGKFPLTVLLRFDGSTKSSAEDLMSKTYSCEADVGTMCPHV